MAIVYDYDKEPENPKSVWVHDVGEENVTYETPYNYGVTFVDEDWSYLITVAIGGDKAEYYLTRVEAMELVEGIQKVAVYE